ncbi:MAG: hypothetical protein QMC95_17825 [Desulfitobacteriaceae bacterium]|nr:hypothetical protein [Desulfitobacteriaceae bacterium]MDI6916043.1 hypothetical protein [Desulfitobacteriaceae bacterium]
MNTNLRRIFQGAPGHGLFQMFQHKVSCPRNPAGGECKYHAQPVDANVLYELRKKAEKISELTEYQKTYALFSKSGFTDRLRELALQNANIVLMDQAHVL